MGENLLARGARSTNVSDLAVPRVTTSRRDRIIPDWIGRSDPSGQLRPGESARYQSASTPQVTQAPTLAEDAVIPIIYGGPERTAGMPYTTSTSADGRALVVSFILCEGEVESVTSIEVNDTAPPAGFVVTIYKGAPGQGIDPTLAATIPGFDETLAGTAYLVCVFPFDVFKNVPRVTAEVYGLKAISDPRSRALLLNGIDQYAAATTLLSLAGSALTIECWYQGNDFESILRCQGSGFYQVFGWGTGPTVISFILNHDGGTSGVSVTRSLIQDGKPHHVAMVWEQGVVNGFRVLIDGVRVNQRNAINAPIPNCNSAAQIGRYVSNNEFGGGTIQEMRIWSVARSDSQIASYMRKRASGAEAGLKACWSMMESAGATALADSSPNGYTAVLNGPPAGPVGATVPPMVSQIVALDPVTPSPSKWTDNPALILGHFMTTYARRVVNAASVSDAAAWCDEIIGGVKRARLTLTLAQARNADEWIEVLRGYLPSWVVFKDSQWHIIPDRASAPVLAYDADTDARVDGESPMVLYRRGSRDVPNVVEVEYTETAKKPWTTRKAVATAGGVVVGEKRKSTLAFPGIRSYAQAYRFAVERLNHFTLEGIEGEVAVFDNGIVLLPGDIVTITDAAHGFAAKPVRVLRVDERDNGRWALRFREYSDAAYSTDAPTTPPTPSSGSLPNPRLVPVVVGLVAAESLKYENASIGNDGIARGLIWQSRIEASWTASADPYFDLYEISIQSAANAQPAISTSRLPQFSSSAVIQGTTYAVSVRQINSLGFASNWTSVNVPVLGKQTPPSDVTVLSFAAEIGGEVILRWVPVPDPDVGRYEWRGLATSATSAGWDSMTILDRPDTNYTRIKGIAPGATLFAIKAIDSVGRYSVNALYVNLIVTSDASAYLNSRALTFEEPTYRTNVTRHTEPITEGGARPLPRYQSTGAVVWDAAMPSPVGGTGNTNAVSINGTTGYVALTGLVNLTVLNAITVECWYKGADFESIFSWRQGPYIIFGEKLASGAGFVGFVLSNDGGTGTPLKIAASLIEDGNLHHVAMVWEQNVVNGFRVLVDGVRVAQRNAANVAMTNPAFAAAIGRNNYNANMYGTGTVQELRVWTTARSDAQIAALMNSKAIGNEAGLKACYSMAETIGATTIADSSPNAYTGTLTGGASLVTAIKAWAAPTLMVDAYGHTALSQIKSGVVWDLGLSVDGTFALDLSKTTLLAGSAMATLRHSTDNVTYTNANVALPAASLSFRGIARFITAEVTAAAGGAFMQEGPIVATVVSQAREESGSATSNAAGPTLVTLGQVYTSAISIDITLGGTVPGSWSVDNVLVFPTVPNSFEVYLFDELDNQIAVPFYWTFRGI